MDVLLDRLNPLIQKEVNRWAGSISRKDLELQAKLLAADAVRSYNPSAGAALATHVMNYLQKLSRTVYAYQNAARIPENKVLQLGTFNRADETLRDRLGRAPSDEELREELGWSRPYMEKYRRNLRREFIESGTPAPIFDEHTGDGGLVDFAYADLPPLQQRLFEHTTGYNGSPVLTNPQLMKQLKLTQGQLSYQKRLLINRLNNVLNGQPVDQRKPK